MKYIKSFIETVKFPLVNDIFSVLCVEKFQQMIKAFYNIALICYGNIIKMKPYITWNTNLIILHQLQILDISVSIKKPRVNN